MRDSYRRTRVVQVMATKVNIHKHTMLSRLPKKRKSSKDMEMSLMENLGNARRKLKHWLTLLTI